MIAPTKFWKPRRKNTRPRQQVSVYAAVRLLLPRRLQAQVGNRLDTLGLKAALAELKSYRDPPKAVLQVVTAVLCLLGLGRLSSLSAWQFVRPQLKPSLPKGMLQFDAARAVTDETPWEESARASAGLTSDEVWKKGSLAVQTMLRWLEVTRLTRKEAGQAAAAEGGKVE